MTWEYLTATKPTYLNSEIFTFHTLKKSPNGLKGVFYENITLKGTIVFELTWVFFNQNQLSSTIFPGYVNMNIAVDPVMGYSSTNY